MVSRIAASLLLALAMFGSSVLARPGYAVDYYVRVPEGVLIVSLVC